MIRNTLFNSGKFFLQLTQLPTDLNLGLSKQVTKYIMATFKPKNLVKSQTLLLKYGFCKKSLWKNATLNS